MVHYTPADFEWGVHFADWASFRGRGIVNSKICFVPRKPALIRRTRVHPRPISPSICRALWR